MALLLPIFIIGVLRWMDMDMIFKAEGRREKKANTDLNC